MPQPETLNESTTETLTVTLSTATVRRMRERISEGQFASESALIEHDVTEADAWAEFESPEESLEAWEMRVVREYEASVLAGTNKTYTLEEVQAHLAARQTARVADEAL